MASTGRRGPQGRAPGQCGGLRARRGRAAGSWPATRYSPLKPRGRGRQGFGGRGEPGRLVFGEDIAAGGGAAVLGQHRPLLCSAPRRALLSWKPAPPGRRHSNGQCLAMGATQTGRSGFAPGSSTPGCCEGTAGSGRPWDRCEQSLGSSPGCARASGSPPAGREARGPARETWPGLPRGQPGETGEGPRPHAPSGQGCAIPGLGKIQTTR